MNSQAMAHKGFYSEQGEYKQYAGCRLWYWHTSTALHIYSYSTIVAEVVTGKNGRKYTLVSNCTYSKTTAGHLNDIRHASPYDILTVPTCTEHYPTQFRRLLEKWNDIKDKEFQKSEVRQEFRHDLYMFDTYQQCIGGLGKLSRLRKSKRIKQLADLCEQVENKRTELRKQLANRTPEEIEAARKKREEAIQRRYDKFVGKDITTSERLRLAFDRKSKIYSEEYVKKYRQHLQADGTPSRFGYYRYSYIWIAGNEVHTSQRISVPLSDVRRLCRLWVRKQRIIGDHAGQYTIVENNDNFVKCGCHVIPTWNIQSICNELQLS